MPARATTLGLFFVTIALAATPARAADYRVGPGEAHASLCALAAAVTFGAGDTIEVAAGTYREACILRGTGTEASPIVLRGAAGARPVMDGSGMNLSGAGSVPRGVLQFNGATWWEVSGLELVGAHNDTDNAAGFRLTANSQHMTFRDMVIHDNDNGVFSDSGAIFTLADSEIYENGAGDGYSHNMYLNGTSVRLIGNHIHDSRGGQNVKIRMHYAELLYNRIVHAGNYELDFIQSADSRMPDSNIVMIGNVVMRRPDADNRGQTIVFGSDNASDTGRTGNLYAFHNTFVLTHASNRLLRALSPGAGARIFFSGNVVHRSAGGADLVADDATAALLDGSHNWIVDGMTVPAGLAETLRGPDPMFESAASVRPADGSPLVDQGPAPDTLAYRDGEGASHPGAPTLEPAEPTGTAARPVVAALDIGAFEHGTAPPPTDGGAGTDGGPSAGDGGGVTGRDGAVPADGGPGPGDGGAGTAEVDGGCGCVVPGGSRPAAPPLALGLLLCAALARRGRRTR